MLLFSEIGDVYKTCSFLNEKFIFLG